MPLLSGSVWKLWVTWFPSPQHQSLVSCHLQSCGWAERKAGSEQDFEKGGGTPWPPLQPQCFWVYLSCLLTTAVTVGNPQGSIREMTRSWSLPSFPLSASSILEVSTRLGDCQAGDMHCVSGLLFSGRAELCGSRTAKRTEKRTKFYRLQSKLGLCLVWLLTCCWIGWRD